MKISSVIFVAAVATTLVLSGSSEASTVECSFELEAKKALQSETTQDSFLSEIPYEVQPVTSDTLYLAHRTGYLPERGERWGLPAIRGLAPLKGRVAEGNRQNINRVLRKFPQVRVFLNRAIDQVIDGCADMPRDSQTWLTEPVIQGYKKLAATGQVFSVELWDGDQLVAGNLGIHSNGHVEGVTMFRDLTHGASNGGGALVEEAERYYFYSRGVQIMDVQVMPPSKNGKPRPGREPMPAADFAQLLRQLNTQSPVLFEGAIPGNRLPVIESDFLERYRQMQAAKSTFYQP